MAGFTRDAALALTVPDGWSPPSLDPSALGYTTTSAGKVSISGQTLEQVAHFKSLGVVVRSTSDGGVGYGILWFMNVQVNTSPAATET